MELVLVRHGETAHNRDGLVQGRVDVPLNTVGIAQATALAASLRGMSVAAVYASPLRRTWGTALAVARVLGLSVQEEPGLIEMDVGEMDGLSLPVLRERYPDFLRRWANDETATLPLPGGESLALVQERAWAAVQRMLAAYPHERVVAVTHNFVIQTILCRALGVPLINFRRLRHDLAAKTVLDIQPERSVLRVLNDRCHLPAELQS